MPGLRVDGEFALRHVHSIPCDSHGHQLVFKDLLWDNSHPTDCGSFWKSGGNRLVNFFSSSQKQLAFLRTCMQNTLGKEYSFIVTVPTRWGIQVASMESILRVQTALKAYAMHPEASKEWKNTLLDDLWWQKLKSLSLLFRPIHSWQKMSESNRATLAKVLPR